MKLACFLSLYVTIGVAKVSVPRSQDPQCCAVL